jgi:heme-degrading monooxygenase HmoA
MKIARHWTGLCKQDRASDYIHHLEQETFPRLKQINGFVRASILNRKTDEGIEFLIITEWNSLDAIRAFAGDLYETAVVPDAAQQMMIRFDTTVRHYETYLTTA